MRKFFVAMMLLATVPFAIAAACNDKNPKCLDEKASISAAKPPCKPSPEQGPHFIFPSASTTVGAK